MKKAPCHTGAADRVDSRLPDLKPTNCGEALPPSGIRAIHERLVAKAPHLLGKQHPRLSPGIWATGFLIGPFSVIAFPHLFIRLMIAKNQLALRRSIFMYAVAMAALFIPITLIGVGGPGQPKPRVLSIFVRKCTLRIYSRI